MKKEDFKHSILDRWDIDIEEKDNYRVHETIDRKIPPFKVV